nr:unnamed protein product [Spirometra erinaceieuropaei]
MQTSVVLALDNRNEVPAYYLAENDGVEFIEIPGKGKVQAQLFENRVRVHCYYDPEEETWIKLPLKWELHSAAVKAIVQLVQVKIEALSCPLSCSILYFITKYLPLSYACFANGP